jgi:hypothetical protein
MADIPAVVAAAIVAHPARSQSARALRDRHPELAARIVYDPDPGGPRTALRTLAEACRTVPDHATHALILQDDVVLCDGFGAQLATLLRDPPPGVLSLFTDWSGRNSSLVRLAVLAGACWAPAVDVYTPTQALLVPRNLAAPMAEFLSTQATPPEPDDVATRRFFAATGVPSLICAPNLVDHRDPPSLVGNDYLGERASACYLPGVPAGHRWASTVLAARCAPYLRWHTGQTYCLRPGTPGQPWVLDDTAVCLSGLDTGPQAVIGLRCGDPDARGAATAVRGDLAEALIDQLWLAGFLLGVAAAETDPGGGLVLGALDEPGPALRAALYTLAAGTIRHQAGPGVAERHRAPLVDLLTTAARAGARLAAVASQ